MKTAVALKVMLNFRSVIHVLIKVSMTEIKLKSCKLVKKVFYVFSSFYLLIWRSRRHHGNFVAYYIGDIYHTSNSASSNC